MALKSSVDNSPLVPVADLSIGTLQVGLGFLQAIIGMMILVSPHQFFSPTYAALRPHLPLWGAAFLILGWGLIAVALLKLPRSVEITAHLLSGSAMIVLAYGIALVGGWTGTTNFGVLGIGTVLAPFIPRRILPWREASRGDWLAAIMGVGATLTGLTILLLPFQFVSPIYDTVRDYLPLLGAAFLVSGLFLTIVQFRPRLPQGAFLAVHLLASATLVTFCLISSVPLRAWIGIAYYGGFGALLACVPWLHRTLYRLDRSALRIRVAMAMAAIAVAPLLLITVFALERQEQATIAVAVEQQRDLALAISQNLSDYIGLHLATVAGLAAQPGLLDNSPQRQQEILRAVRSTHPDMYVMVTYGRSNDQIARTDDNPPQSAVRTILTMELDRTGRPAVVTETSTTNGRPIVAVGAPVIGENGDRVGAVAAGVDAAKIEEVLSSARSSSQVSVYLVDSQGRVIAHEDRSKIADAADLSAEPPVRAMLFDNDGSGAMQYGPSDDSRLAGYARLPDLGWGVVVEQPAALVLEGARDQRDWTFAALLIVVASAAAVGLYAGHKLVQPLVILVSAVSGIAAGRDTLSLPTSGISEIQALSKAISQMRADLAANETERQRLLESERAARVEAEAAVRARDEFISVAAHELKTPVTSLQGHAQLLARQFQKTGKMDPERIARAMEQISHQSKRLTRLTEQLLDLSRLEAGKLALSMEEVDLSVLVRETVVQAEHTYPNRNIAVGGETQLRARVDPLRLEQVFTNLLDNAVKFSPKESPIRIELERDGGGWVRIAVEDRGIGIPEEKRNLVFERFFQAHEERHYGGMGIGLHVSRQIVEMHGGTIGFEQPPEGGSRFVVRLPSP